MPGGVICMSEVKRSEERTVYYCIVVKSAGPEHKEREQQFHPPGLIYSTMRKIPKSRGGGHGHVQESLAEIHPPGPKVGHARHLPQAHNLHKISHAMTP